MDNPVGIRLKVLFSQVNGKLCCCFLLFAIFGVFLFIQDESYLQNGFHFKPKAPLSNEEQVKEYEQALDAIHKEKDEELQGRAADFENELKEKDNEIAALKAEMEELKAQHREREDEISSEVGRRLGEQIDAIKAEKVELEEKVQELEQLVEASKGNDVNLDKIRECHSEKADIRSDLRGQISDVRDELKGCQENIQNLETDKKNLEKEKENIEREKNEEIDKINTERDEQFDQRQQEHEREMDELRTEHNRELESKSNC